MKQYVPNDLKKGDLVMLKSEMMARIEDNKKGQIRMAYVFGEAVGLFNEMGSIYATDIVAVNVNEEYKKFVMGLDVRDRPSPRWVKVTLPRKYAETTAMRSALGL